MSVNNAHRTQTERSQKGKPGGRDAKSVDGATSGVAAGWMALVLLPALAIAIILYCWAVEDPLWCLPGSGPAAPAGPGPRQPLRPPPPGACGQGRPPLPAALPVSPRRERTDPGSSASLPSRSALTER